MTELVEFLKARLAEDEAQANARLDREVHLMRHDGMGADYSRAEVLALPASSQNVDGYGRVLNEIAAKRGVIKEVSEMSGSLRERGVHVPFALTWILMHLAGVYSEHPDFKADWSI